MESLINGLFKYKKNRVWLELSLDFIKSVIDDYNYISTNPAISLIFTKNSHLNFVVGKRMVLSLYPPDNLGLIWPIIINTEVYGCFHAVKGYLSQNEYKDALWVLPVFLEGQEIHPDVKNIWMEEVHNVARRTRQSPYRKFHNSLFYEIVTNLNFRKETLREIFM